MWYRVIDECLLHCWTQLLGEAEHRKFDCMYPGLLLPMRVLGDKEAHWYHSREGKCRLRNGKAKGYLEFSGPYRLGLWGY